MYRLNSVSIVAQCPPVPQQNLHNTSSPLRLHQPTQPAPTHMLTVQGRIWISVVREHCAGRAALSDLQQEEIKDEEQSDCRGLAWRKMAYVARAKARLIVGLKLHVSIHSHTRQHFRDIWLLTTNPLHLTKMENSKRTILLWSKAQVFIEVM